MKKALIIILLLSLIPAASCLAETIVVVDGVVRLPGAGHYKLTVERGQPPEVRRVVGLAEDEVAVFSPSDGNTAIYVRHDGYFLSLQQGCGFVLNHVNDRLWFIGAGAGQCVEISRLSGGD